MLMVIRQFRSSIHTNKLLYLPLVDDAFIPKLIQFFQLCDPFLGFTGLHAPLSVKLVDLTVLPFYHSEITHAPPPFYHTQITHAVGGY